MSSINAATIGTLVNAITGGLTSGQTYDLVRKISEDLDSVFSTVNSGPLKAVDASALLHIDPHHIDSPGDSPQNITSPGPVAFNNIKNIFTFDQRITKNYSTWETDFNAAEIGRMQSHIANGTFFGNNMKFNGGVWAKDTGNPGSAISFVAGGTFFLTFVGALGVSGSIDVNGIWSIGFPGTVVNAAVNDMIFMSAKNIRFANNAVNNTLRVIGKDVNDIFRLGQDAASGGQVGHIGIPKKTTANMPAAGANQDGIIAIDTTTNQLCYWVGGVRLAIAVGVAF